jgi:hypothetical protein
MCFPTATYTIDSEGKLAAVNAPANGASMLVRTNEQIAPPDAVELSAVADGLNVALKLDGLRRSHRLPGVPLLSARRWIRTARA